MVLMSFGFSFQLSDFPFSFELALESFASVSGNIQLGSLVKGISKSLKGFSVVLWAPSLIEGGLGFRHLGWFLHVCPLGSTLFQRRLLVSELRVALAVPLGASG